jgi:hypothetical protein
VVCCSNRVVRYCRLFLKVSVVQHSSYKRYRIDAI